MKLNSVGTNHTYSGTGGGRWGSVSIRLDLKTPDTSLMVRTALGKINTIDHEILLVDIHQAPHIDEDAYIPEVLIGKVFSNSQIQKYRFINISSCSSAIIAPVGGTDNEKLSVPLADLRILSVQNKNEELSQEKSFFRQMIQKVNEGLGVDVLPDVNTNSEVLMSVSSIRERYQLLIRSMDHVLGTADEFTIDELKEQYKEIGDTDGEYDVRFREVFSGETIVVNDMCDLIKDLHPSFNIGRKSVDGLLKSLIEEKCLDESKHLFCKHGIKRTISKQLALYFLSSILDQFIAPDGWLTRANFQKTVNDKTILMNGHVIVELGNQKLDNLINEIFEECDNEKMEDHVVEFIIPRPRRLYPHFSPWLQSKLIEKLSGMEVKGVGWETTDSLCHILGIATFQKVISLSSLEEIFKFVENKFRINREFYRGKFLDYNGREYTYYCPKWVDYCKENALEALLS